jgi:hypothetical protein
VKYGEYTLHVVATILHFAAGICSVSRDKTQASVMSRLAQQTAPVGTSEGKARHEFLLSSMRIQRDCEDDEQEFLVHTSVQTWGQDSGTCGGIHSGRREVFPKKMQKLL